MQENNNFCLPFKIAFNLGPNPWEVQAHLGGDGEFAGPCQELLALPTPHTELQRSPHPLLPHRQVWSLIMFFSSLIPYGFRIRTLDCEM